MNPTQKQFSLNCAEGQQFPISSIAETEQARLHKSAPKKKAIRHENKIESFGKQAVHLADDGESPAGNSHYQEPTPFPRNR